MSTNNGHKHQNVKSNLKLNPIKTIGIGDEVTTVPSPSFKNPFKKPIVGDIFGSSILNQPEGVERLMLGLMYRSRIDEIKSRKESKSDSFDNDSEESRELQRKNSNATLETLDTLEESAFDNINGMNPRQQLAVTIRNWSMIPSNDAHIIKEGAVHALVALTGFDDPIIKECCAAGNIKHINSIYIFYFV